MQNQSKIEDIYQTLTNAQAPLGADALLLLEDGTLYWGNGAGAHQTKIGEVVFNTAMTGYQEILTDPSYAAQIICFSFPHIGNIGCNPQDEEDEAIACHGMISARPITNPSNFRANEALNDWLKRRELSSISNIDTRHLVHHIRNHGAPKAALVHDSEDAFQDGRYDLVALYQQIHDWSGLEGLDLASKVSVTEPMKWSDGGLWRLNHNQFKPNLDKPRFHIVAIDYGMKRNILRNFAEIGADITIVPFDYPAEKIKNLKPDGVFLSNGPGDPAATGEKVLPIICSLIDENIPLFGICLGHQILALALGAKTMKMRFGHHGANHPILDLTTQKVEITSQNHGFVVDKDTLPAGISATHYSLFDQTLAGFQADDKPIMGVQYHPEASPGPQDSAYLFSRFADMIKNSKRLDA